MRAFGVSQGHLTGPASTSVPNTVDELIRLYPEHLENVRKISAQELVAKAREPLRPEDSAGLANEAMNRNTWLPYVPSALALVAGRLLHAPALVLLYRGRLANLAGYIALVWAALRLIPAGRMILLTVALMPMVIHQAASLSVG